MRPYGGFNSGKPLHGQTAQARAATSADRRRHSDPRVRRRQPRPAPAARRGADAAFP